MTGRLSLPGRRSLALGIVLAGGAALSGALPLSDTARRGVVWGTGASAAGVLGAQVLTGRRSPTTAAVLLVALLLFFLGYFGGGPGFGVILGAGGGSPLPGDSHEPGGTGASGSGVVGPCTDVPPGTICLGF